MRAVFVRMASIGAILFTWTSAALPLGLVEAGRAVVSSSAADDSRNLVGTWVGGAGDSGASYVVRLELYADGTYKKTLSAKVNNPDGGHNGYGGTHTGTWTSEGKVVHLSGDGNWPPYSHDLSKFHRVE